MIPEMPAPDLIRGGNWVFGKVAGTGMTARRLGKDSISAAAPTVGIHSRNRQRARPSIRHVWNGGSVGRANPKIATLAVWRETAFLHRQR
jgi:hypothetical protein